MGLPLSYPAVEPNWVFLNIPYDASYEPLYLALIAGLCGFGLVPKATLQIPGSERRLDRIFNLMRACRYSFHDISRVELDLHPPRTPRFNMPFELGLAVAWAKYGNPTHEWVVFESRKHRQKKSLSDLDGTEIYIHDSKPLGLLRALTNVLAGSRQRPTMAELRAVYRETTQAATKLKKELATESLYDARPFQDLLLAAQLQAQKSIASLR